MLLINKTIRSLSLAALLGFAALLSGCGGGGAVPPSVVVAPADPLVVFPASLTVYSGTPAVVTIVSGAGPFQAFSSDSVVLPVTQNVSGAAITLVANAIEAGTPSPTGGVAADRIVSLTIRDALGRNFAVTATVKASPLLGSIQIIPAASTKCASQTPSGTPTSDNASFCSGETATARITVKSSGAVPLPNRQIRYDVVQGAYNFVLDQAGTVLAKAATIVTDQNGQAIVTIKSDAPVPTQVALIRATDLVSGNRVDGSFTIVQATDGTPTLSVNPDELKFTATFKGQCGSGSGDFKIYGGTPPYTVFNPLTNFFTLSVAGVAGQSVVVPVSGGTFRASTTGFGCGFINFSITDAAGRVLNKPKFTSEEGATEVPKPAEPSTLVVTPPTVTVACNAGVTVNFAISGGAAPYIVATNRPNTGGTLAPNGASVSGSSVTLNQSFAAPTEILISVTDVGSRVAGAKIVCQP